MPIPHIEFHALQGLLNIANCVIEDLILHEDTTITQILNEAGKKMYTQYVDALDRINPTLPANCIDPDSLTLVTPHNYWHFTTLQYWYCAHEIKFFIISSMNVLTTVTTYSTEFAFIVK